AALGGPDGGGGRDGGLPDAALAGVEDDAHRMGLLVCRRSGGGRPRCFVIGRRAHTRKAIRLCCPYAARERVIAWERGDLRRPRELAHRGGARGTNCRAPR